MANSSAEHASGEPRADDHQRKIEAVIEEKLELDPFELRIVPGSVSFGAFQAAYCSNGVPRSKAKRMVGFAFFCLRRTRWAPPSRSAWSDR